MIYAWQQTQWQQLNYARVKNQLPHALLLTGIKGLGKRQFAELFSQSLLCSSLLEDHLPCGQCHACHLAINKTHPNVLWIEPEKEGQAIKIDQIRFANEFIQQTSLQGHYRVVIIDPANQMNLSAANALLKTLEEPAPQALILLIAEQSARLPATILSRCQRLFFKRPAHDDALNFLQNTSSQAATSNFDLLLKLTNGAPLAALNVSKDQDALRKNMNTALYKLALQQENPLTLAADLQEFAMTILDLIVNILMDIAHLKLGDSFVLNEDFHQELQVLQTKISVQTMTELLEYLLKVRAQLMGGIHLNKQLLLEDIFLRWMESVCF